MEHSTSTVPQGRAPMSPIRKRYWIELVIRCIIFLFCVLLWLRHLPHFQLGPSDDVYTPVFRPQFLFLEPVFSVGGSLLHVGIERPAAPGAILGAVQRSIEVFQLHR